MFLSSIKYLDTNNKKKEQKLIKKRKVLKCSTRASKIWERNRIWL